MLNRKLSNASGNWRGFFQSPPEVPGRNYRVKVKTFVLRRGIVSLFASVFKSFLDRGLIGQQGFLNFGAQGSNGATGNGRTGDVVDLSAVFGNFVVRCLFALELVKKTVGGKTGRSRFPEVENRFEVFAFARFGTEPGGLILIGDEDRTDRTVGVKTDDGGDIAGITEFV